MALFHLHVRNISRGDGRSAVACAAYRAGETLPNEAEEKDSAFGGRRDVVFAEIRAPIAAAAWMRERAPLWNAVERAEKRKDARLAKEIEFALPRELPRSQWLALAREMADAYVTRGHIVDLAIHDDGTAHNPHVHLMLTTRAIEAEGFGPKIREADGRQFVQEARARWATIANAALGPAGVAPIDPRSHAARGITEPPGHHHAPDRDARRERREERAHMDLQHEVISARNELLAASDIRARYPLLSARPDWPPEQRLATGYLPPEVKAEHDRFWKEVHQRALEPEHEAADPRPADPPEQEELARDIGGLADVAAAVEGQKGVLERHMALEDARATFSAIRERMVTEMVRAGLMDPCTAEHVRLIEQKLYPDEFARQLAEARRNAEVRSQVWGGPEPTRAQVRQLAEIERAEAERHIQENTIAFEPVKEPSNSLQRVLAAQARGGPETPASPEPGGPAFNRGWLSDLLQRAKEDEALVQEQPVPDPDGRPIPPAELAQAEERMIEDAEAPARDSVHAPTPDRAPEAERLAAEAAAERIAQLEVPEAEADRYRLAPQEDRLDWLSGMPRAQVAEPREESPAPAREDRLDWLRKAEKPEPRQETQRGHEPDRYQR